jgi:hypothetical protein
MSMYPKQLIGRKVLRTKAHKSTGSRSFMDNPITIIAVSESHILYRWEGNFRKLLTNPDEICILASDYIDDNWTSYDKLMKLTEPKFPVKQILILRKWLNSLFKKQWLNSLFKKNQWLK